MKTQKNDGAWGFSRMDLVAALAGVAVVIGLAVPALGTSGVRSGSQVCLDNLQALMRASALYAAENRDRYPMGLHGPGGDLVVPIDYSQPNSPRPWATGWLTWNDQPANTNHLLLVDRRYAVLADYTKDVRLYKCPSDRLLHPSQKELGWTGRVRSYSMNGAVGAGNSSPVDQLLAAEKFFMTTSDVVRPAPSNLFVFIEENPDALNDPVFLNSQTWRQWIDMPGALHPGGGTNLAGNLAFADGHGETKVWRSTVLRETPDLQYRPPSVPAGDPDWGWLMDRMSWHRNAVR